MIYHFNSGAMGFVATVKADTPAEALKILREALQACGDNESGTLDLQKATAAEGGLPDSVEGGIIVFCTDDVSEADIDDSWEDE